MFLFINSKGIGFHVTTSPNFIVHTPREDCTLQSHEPKTGQHCSKARKVFQPQSRYLASWLLPIPTIRFIQKVYSRLQQHSRVYSWVISHMYHQPVARQAGTSFLFNRAYWTKNRNRFLKIQPKTKKQGFSLYSLCKTRKMWHTKIPTNSTIHIHPYLFLSKPLGRYGYPPWRDGLFFQRLPRLLDARCT